MATQNNTGFQTFITTAAISAYRRVLLDSSGQINLASNDATAIGFIQHDAASGDPATVKLGSASGSYFGVADTAITRGDAIYPAASGKISGTVVSGTVLGYAAQASSANLDVIEIIPPNK